MTLASIVFVSIMEQNGVIVYGSSSEGAMQVADSLDDENAYG